MVKKVVRKTKVAKSESPSSPKPTGKASGKKQTARKTRSHNTLQQPLQPDTDLVDRAVQNNATYLTAEQLNHFRRLLLEKLAEITGDVNHIESGALKTSRADATGDLSSMPIHMADIGSDNYEQEFALGLMHSERQIVHEIIAALKRIDNGTYGICEGTGEQIPLTRLNGIPWTRHCLKYAARMEKGHSNQVQQYSYEPQDESDQDQHENAEQPDESQSDEHDRPYPNESEQ